MPGARLVPAARPVLHQPLGERAVLVARRRMHHHAGRLVDDQQPVVLVDDVVRHVLRRERLGGSGPRSHATSSPARTVVPLAHRSAGRPSRGPRR